MMTRSIAAVLLHLWLLGTLPLAAQGGMREVPPGREIKDSKLLSPNLTDVWKLDVDAGEVLWCVVDSQAFDPVLELYDSDDMLLGQDDGSGTHSELTLLLEHKGPVQFRVHGFQGSGGGRYDFWLQRYRTEPLAANGEATHTFAKEQWWHFRVPMHDGDVLVPTVQGEGRLTAVFDRDRGGVGDCHGGFLASHDGDLFVRVEGAEGRRCQVSMQLARQRELPMAAPADDRVPPFGFDLWRVRLQAGHAYALDLTMPEAQLEFDWRERHPGEQPGYVWTGDLDKGGRRHRWVMARCDCELEVLLRNRGGSGVPYRLGCTSPDQQLSPGIVTAAQLGRREGDLYRLDLTAGDLLRVRLGSRDFDAHFDLWDPDGNVFARVDDRSPLDLDAEHTFLVPRSGCYRLLAFCEGGGGSGDYQLQAEVLPLPALQPGCGQPVQLQNGGTAYLHLPLQAGQEIWLSVRSTAFDAGLTVLDPSGAAFVGEGGGRGGDVLVAYVASHTGVHTLLVHSRSGAGAGEIRAIVP